MKITKIGTLGLMLIKEYEGYSSTPYQCPAGVWTIGFGSTRYEDGTKVKETDNSITRARGTQLLLNTLKTYEQAVDSYATDKLTQNQFDALVSFTYNLGPAALKSSTLLKKVNNNPNDENIDLEFMKWTYCNGKKLLGLLKRRLAEANLYNL